MALQEKYQELISFANNSGTTNLSAVEQDNILYVTGTAPTESVKKQIWAIYEKIDPEMSQSIKQLAQEKQLQQKIKEMDRGGMSL